MDVLHEELKEPVPSTVVVIKPETSKNPVNKSSVRSKRLLGGQTILDKHNRYLPEGKFELFRVHTIIARSQWEIISSLFHGYLSTSVC